MTKKIKKIYIKDYGDFNFIEATEEEPIEEIFYNGEMASVRWFKKGKEEFNGKYVYAVVYY